MEYEGVICHPPMERTSFKLLMAVGCAYNRCKFCSFFKHLKYRLLPLEQVEEELRRVRRFQPFFGLDNRGHHIPLR